MYMGTFFTSSTPTSSGFRKVTGWPCIFLSRSVFQPTTPASRKATPSPAALWGEAP